MIAGISHFYDTHMQMLFMLECYNWKEFGKPLLQAMLFEFWDGKINGLAKSLHSRKSFWKCRTLGFFFLFVELLKLKYFPNTFLSENGLPWVAPTFCRQTSCPEEAEFLQAVTTPCYAVTQRHLLFFPLNYFSHYILKNSHHKWEFHCEKHYLNTEQQDSSWPKESTIWEQETIYR